MAHLAALGRGQARDIGHNRLFHMIAGIGCGLGLLRAADFADHHHGIGFRIRLKQLKNVAEA
jgi:hypothetical protein